MTAHTWLGPASLHLSAPLILRRMLCREVADFMLEKEGQGATCVLVAVAQSVVGAFAIKDPLKPEVCLPSFLWPLR